MGTAGEDNSAEDNIEAKLSVLDIAVLGIVE